MRLLALMSCWLALPVLAATYERKVTVDGKDYVVSYNVYECSPPEFAHCMVSVPVTMPPGQPHYEAQITVYYVGVYQLGADLHRQIGEPFAGIWTPNGCFEDDPEALVKFALEPPSPKAGPATTLDASGNITVPGTLEVSPLTGVAGYTSWDCADGNVQLDYVPSWNFVSGWVVVMSPKVCEDHKWVKAKLVIE